MTETKKVPCGSRRPEDAVSPVIGVVLMVTITVLVAATTGALLTGSALTGEDIETPATGGITFNYDYDSDSDMMRVSVTDPGNVERLYIIDRGTGFEEDDIVEARGGWNESLVSRNAAGQLSAGGERVVNSNVRAGDKLILDNVSPDDDLVLLADRGVGTDETVVGYWESDNWSYT